MSVEEVVKAHPHLTLAQVHAALAFYYDNKEEVDASIREGDAFVEETRAKSPPSPLAEKLRALRNKP
jgi:hypothetical protein